jgi:hypothetical protein
MGDAERSRRLRLPDLASLTALRELSDVQVSHLVFHSKLY